MNTLKKIPKAEVQKKTSVYIMENSFFLFLALLL